MSEEEMDTEFKGLILQINNTKEAWMIQCLVVHNLLNELKMSRSDFEVLEDIGNLTYLQKEYLVYKDKKIGKFEVWITDSKIHAKGEVLNVPDRNTMEA